MWNTRPQERRIIWLKKDRHNFEGCLILESDGPAFVVLVGMAVLVAGCLGLLPQRNIMEEWTFNRGINAPKGGTEFIDLLYLIPRDLFDGREILGCFAAGSLVPETNNT